MFSLSLRTESISKSYARGLLFKTHKKILDGVSLEVKKGETLVIMGESGAGKTSLGKIIAGLEKPTKGAVLYAGKSLPQMDSLEHKIFRSRVQMVFQNPEASLNPRKTIETSLKQVLKLTGMPAGKREEVLFDTLETVGLHEDVLHRYPNQLSGGQNQRVVLARVLFLDPDFIILDEPTSALDISVQAQILHLLKRLQQEKKMGYVFISHDRAVAEFVSDRIGILENGRLNFS
ncbi:MAG: ABC transporter ATP-binding protein [Candidatus Aminicenantes bacterium]|nr:ABC transporter ATP-binding protein [Candidatus Aminicenantes bacterium]